MTKDTIEIDKIAAWNTKIKEGLSVWQSMGYDSAQEANADAAVLFKNLYDQGFFKSKPIARNMVQNPKVFIMTKFVF